MNEVPPLTLGYARRLSKVGEKRIGNILVLTGEYHRM
jgi:hypothetical protein